MIISSLRMHQLRRVREYFRASCFGILARARGIDTRKRSPQCAPESTDWIREDHRIIGATRKNSELWFDWSAATGDGSGGGFKFPQAHIQIAKFDLEHGFKLIEQTQV